MPIYCIFTIWNYVILIIGHRAYSYIYILNLCMSMCPNVYLSSLLLSSHLPGISRWSVSEITIITVEGCENNNNYR